MRVLIVDDSVVFRTQITNALKAVPAIEIVGTAPNGEIALQKLDQMQVDLMTLDMEMPGLNGIEVLQEMKKRGHKTKVIVFSSQTYKGAEKALEALREGANDIVGKPRDNIQSFEEAAQAIQDALVPKVLQFMEGQVRRSSTVPERKIEHFTPSSSPTVQTYKKVSLSQIDPAIVVLGSSTGGPTALEAIFQKLVGPLKKPLFITQHMPPVFTALLAKRLQEISGIPCTEAKDNEAVENNHVYIAPGDYHMTLARIENKLILKLDQTPPQNSVRPAVDPLFQTAAQIYGSRLLGVVLTGMGEDGLIGARTIKNSGGGIAIQNKESCVVFGMPGAIFNENLQDDQGNLEWIASLLNRTLGSKP